VLALKPVCCPQITGQQTLSEKATLTSAHAPARRQQAAAYRHEEAKRLRGIAWLQGLFGLTLFAGPVFVGIVSFAAYQLSGNDLTPAKTFTSLAFFTLLRFPLGFLPQIILSIVSARVALTRIAGFLGQSEVGDSDPRYITYGTPGRVKITGASFKWDADSDRDTTLRDINLECSPGQLTMIVGAVGCGKSSLLATIFQQITRLEGTVEVGGAVAYVPQTAWIMNETIRENVLMGKPMDEDRCASCFCTSACFQQLLHKAVRRVFHAVDL
jgi:ATP-binding cassette, subfamily C (CFTR/MRP), member 1